MSIESEALHVAIDVSARYRTLAIKLNEIISVYEDAVAKLKRQGASTKLLNELLSEANARCLECMHKAGWEVRK